MAWKNIKQRSLGAALIVAHKGLTELDDVQNGRNPPSAYLPKI
jgi:hypothetical protein